MLTLPNGTPLYSRDEWGADTSKWRWNNGTRATPIMMDLPVAKALQHHSVTTPTNSIFGDMRTIEDIGLSRFGRFSYSWAWHPEGAWLEGCGDWVGAHTAGYNSTAFGLVLIGNYETAPPPIRVVNDMRAMIAYLEETNRLRDSTYPTTDHQGAGGETACSGKFARALMPAMRQPWVTPQPPIPPQPILLSTGDENVLITLTGSDTHFLLSGGKLVRVEDHPSLTSIRKSVSNGSIGFWEVTQKQLETLKKAYPIVDT